MLVNEGGLNMAYPMNFIFKQIEASLKHGHAASGRGLTVTKFGPWLLFDVNDLKVNGFNVVKYADDTTFYKPVVNPEPDSVVPAIAATQIWSEQNSMTLNAEKTEITNVFLNYRNRYDDDVLVNDVYIKPTVNGKHLKRLLMWLPYISSQTAQNFRYGQ